MDEKHMERALSAARRASERGEVPIGAVVVHEGEVIAAAGNSPISLRDPTAHAEILAIREAAERLGAYRIPGAELYVTLEPCMMCFGAILHARISRLVYGASDPKVGFSTRYQRLRDDAWLNHEFEIVGGVMADESRLLLKDFFAMRR